MLTFDVALPVDLRSSLAPLVASAQDPTIRVRHDRVIRAAWTPEGAATLTIHQIGPQRFTASAVGPGHRWALAHAPGLVGADDDLDGFDASAHPTVARAHRLRPGLRIVRSGQIQDLVIQTILAQRVTAVEAARAWTLLVRRWGSAAPGPSGLRLPPRLDELARTPSWAFHRFGVERSRAQRIAAACRALARSVNRSDSDGQGRLSHLPGVGPWTRALVARTAFGDPDAVEVGDYHVKNHIIYALTGEPRGSDEQMLDLLAPFAGHRGRVVRLLISVMRRAPSFGPRQPIVDIERS